MGRYLGMKIYHSRRNSVKTFYLEISKLRDQNIPRLMRKNELTIPKPDAQFFNAILDIVCRHPHIPPRKLRRVPRHYSWRYRKSYLNYIRKWVQVKPPSPDLLEVGRDMMAAGFAIPLLFQKFFVEARGLPILVRPSSWGVTGVMIPPVQNTKIFRSRYWNFPGSRQSRALARRKRFTNSLEERVMTY